MSTWRSAILLGWLLATATGCQEGNPPAASGTSAPASEPASPPSSPYVQDLERICHCEERSGALARPEGERPVLVAQWLGSNVETDEGHAFLVRLAKTGPEGKAAVLEEEAARVGLTDCPLARTWQSDSSPGETAPEAPE